MLKRRRPHAAVDRLAEVMTESEPLEGRRQGDASNRVVEAIPHHQLLQRRRKHDLFDGLVQAVSEFKSPKRNWPLHADDSLMKSRSKGDLLYRRRPPVAILWSKLLPNLTCSSDEGQVVPSTHWLKLLPKTDEDRLTRSISRLKLSPNLMYTSASFPQEIVEPGG